MAAGRRRGIMDAVIRSLAFAVGILALLPTLCGAQVYRWEEDGAVHFGRSPARLEAPCGDPAGRISWGAGRGAP